jgi:hypothetical protein
MLPVNPMTVLPGHLLTAYLDGEISIQILAGRGNKVKRLDPLNQPAGFAIAYQVIRVRNLLTEVGEGDRIGVAWERSSMVEQRPFKPLVEGSSPSALTFLLK